MCGLTVKYTRKRVLERSVGEVLHYCASGFEDLSHEYFTLKNVTHTVETMIKLSECNGMCHLFLSEICKSKTFIPL